MAASGEKKEDLRDMSLLIGDQVGAVQVQVQQMAIDEKKKSKFNMVSHRSIYWLKFRDVYMIVLYFV